jgi:hypothetical protein
MRAAGKLAAEVLEMAGKMAQVIVLIVSLQMANSVGVLSCFDLYLSYRHGESN